MAMGVYALFYKDVCLYIGESKDVFGRWGEHLTMLNKGTHYCTGLQKWFDGHSYTDISRRILEDAGFPSKLCLLERKWFDRNWRRKPRLLRLG